MNTLSQWANLISTMGTNYVLESPYIRKMLPDLDILLFPGHTWCLKADWRGDVPSNTKVISSSASMDKLNVAFQKYYILFSCGGVLLWVCVELPGEQVIKCKLYDYVTDLGVQEFVILDGR